MTKEDINKACNWLEKNLETRYGGNFYREHIISTYIRDNKQAFINRFKKAMED